ncbi:MAG: hypothetical protein QME81_09635, partial [bacterium]|nr:hypothetical protein [bacterium]
SKGGKKDRPAYFTYDYTGFNHFEYELRARDTGQVIGAYNQGAWGNVGDLSLKTTGWQPVNIDLSAYQGRPLRLSLNCGGTGDTLYATWCYIDGLATHAVPTSGCAPLAVNFNSLFSGDIISWWWDFGASFHPAGK